MFANPTTPLNTLLLPVHVRGEGWLVDSYRPGHGHTEHDEAAVEEEGHWGDTGEVLDYDIDHVG